MAKFEVSMVTTLLATFSLLVMGVIGEDSFPSSICVTWLSSEECVGGDRALTSTHVTVHL